jgi:hypothetical protein
VNRAHAEVVLRDAPCRTVGLAGAHVHESVGRFRKKVDDATTPYFQFPLTNTLSSLSTSRRFLSHSASSSFGMRIGVSTSFKLCASSGSGKLVSQDGKGGALVVGCRDEDTVGNSFPVEHSDSTHLLLYLPTPAPTFPGRFKARWHGARLTSQLTASRRARPQVHLHSYLSLHSPQLSWPGTLRMSPCFS